MGAVASDTNAVPVGTIRSVLALNNRQPVCQYLQNRPIAVFDSEYGCAPLIKATWASAAYQSHAYSFALVACRQHLYLIVVEDDPKFMEISLSLTTRDRWWKNKLWNPFNRNKGKIRLRKRDNLHFLGRPKHPMTLIRLERYFRCNGSIKNSTFVFRLGGYRNATT